MAKRIIAVGKSYFPADHDQKIIECTRFRSHISLVDADIAVIFPTINSYSYSSYEEGFSYREKNYMGKPCIGDNGSGLLIEDYKFWRLEIENALASGKTVFVISEKPEEFYYSTGKKEHSATGRNRQTTNIVNLFNSYKILPFDLTNHHAASGSEIKYIGKDSLLRTIWEENKEYFHYEAVFEPEVFGQGALFSQKKGKGILGGIIKSKEGGKLVVLPALELEHDNFSEYREDPNDDNKKKEYWTDEASAFTHRFAGALVKIDKVLRGQSGKTPPPQWIEEGDFVVEEEVELKGKILDIEEKINGLEDKKSKIVSQAIKAASPKDLLFETGTPLENAILDVLKLLGFKAERYQDDDSEFDAVFSSKEGVFLGESEGKDVKAVDVTKISQLMRNVTEYLQKDDVTEPPKAVLFGNGYRLTKPSERKKEFTEKCIKVSKQQRIALVRTSDLFPIALYLSKKKNASFKKKCREAILNTEDGIVKFPEVPD